MLEAFADWFIVQALQLWYDFGQFLIIREFLRDGILLEVHVSQARHTPEVFDLFNGCDIVPLAVEDSQVLAQAHVEEVLDRVVGDVELL